MACRVAPCVGNLSVRALAFRELKLLQQGQRAPRRERCEYPNKDERDIEQHLKEEADL